MVAGGVLARAKLNQAEGESGEDDRMTTQPLFDGIDSSNSNGSDGNTGP